MKLKIRSKFYLSIFLILLFFIISLLHILFVQKDKLKDLQKSTSNEKAESLQRILDLQSKELQSLIYFEYSKWDEMVNFIYTKDPNFSAVNLAWLTDDYDFCSVWVYDTLNNLTGYASENFKKNFSISSDLLLKIGHEQRTIKYYDQVDNKLYEFFGASIQKSDDDYALGRIYGYLIAAREVNDGFLHELGNFLNCDLSFRDAAKLDTLSNDVNSYAKLSFPKILYNWKNEPIAELTAVFESQIIKEAQQAANTMLIIYSVISIIILGIYIFSFLYIMSRPLKLISHSLHELSSANLGHLLSSHDEFGDIAKMINDFFDQKMKLESEITQRISAENSLQLLNKDLENRVITRTEELSALIQQAPLAIGVFDQDGLLIEKNSVYNNLFNLEIGKEFRISEMMEIMFFHSNNYSDHLAKILKNGGDFYTVPIKVDSLDDSESNIQWLIFRFYSIKAGKKNTFRVVNLIEDITQNKKAEEVEKKLLENEKISLAIFSAQEEERKRVSRELHDSIGQKLSAVQMQLELYNKSPEKNGIQLKEIKSTIITTGKELRNIIHNLHPQDLDEYGLTRALEMLCNEIRNLSNIEVFFNCYGDQPKINPNIELNLFRIVQEALNNITKHSSATEASVQIYYRDDNIIINIEDNGHGFDFETYMDNNEIKSFGILNMKKRAESLGGNLYIDSSESLGTEIQVKIPWEI